MEEIEIDRGVIKALSSDTRSDILKSLSERRKTVTEVATYLNLSKSNAHEHLSKLVESGLVRKVDSPNKWIYYELTWKGYRIIQNNLKKIILIFTTAIIALGGGIFESLKFMTASQPAFKAVPASPGLEAGGEAMRAFASPISMVDLILAVSLITVGVCLTYIWMRMKLGMFGRRRFI